jgi:[calcium/calmodulin-dependent protein kinase] kinase
LSQLLNKNPENRITIKEIKTHPWITNNGTDPMPELELEEIKLTKDEKKQTFTRIKMIANIILKFK